MEINFLKKKKAYTYCSPELNIHILHVLRENTTRREGKWLPLSGGAPQARKTFLSDFKKSACFEVL